MPVHGMWRAIRSARSGPASAVRAGVDRVFTFLVHVFLLIIFIHHPLNPVRGAVRPSQSLGSLSLLTLAN
jgi:hypothetical protein